MSFLVLIHHSRVFAAHVVRKRAFDFCFHFPSRVQPPNPSPPLITVFENLVTRFHWGDDDDDGDDKIIINNNRPLSPTLPRGDRTRTTLLMSGRLWDRGRQGQCTTFCWRRRFLPLKTGVSDALTTS